jgi:hypothetical protein
MKKILVLFLFLVAAVASFAQIDSINYPARKMPFGNWDFIWTNGALTDTVKVYPEKGGIGLDTLFFSDGTKQATSATGKYVELDGDTMAGTYFLSSGKLIMSAGTGSETSINWGNTSTYSTFGHKLDQYSLTIRSGWAGISPLGTYIANDTIILTGGYLGVDVDTITSSSMSAPYYTFNIPSIILNGEINGLAYESNDILMADDASIILTNGISGWGEVYAFDAGTIDEWAEFIISSDGTVYLKSNSTDAVNTDTDDKLCIFDNGSGVTIRNRLGGARTIKYIIHH